MRHPKINIIVFALIGLFLSSNLSIALEDKLLAIINDEIITEKDVKDFINAFSLQLSSQYEGKELKAKIKEIEDEALDRLIEDRLMLQRANDLGAEVKNTTVEPKYQFMKSQFPSDEEFVLYLKMKDLTPADLKEKIKGQIVMRYLVEAEVESKVFVHPQEVTDYYQNHPDEFKDTEKLELDSIFIRVEASEKDAAEKVKEIQRRLKKGEDFTILVDEFSEAKTIGTVRHGQLNEEIEKIVFALKINEVSVPVRTNTGFYIFKLKERSVGEIIVLEDIRDQISQYLFQRKFEERFAEWMEDLKENAYILIK